MPNTDGKIELKALIEGGRATLSGTFRIPIDPRYDHHEVGPGALVMVASTPASFVACRPFRSRVPMADDVTIVDGVASGRFSLDLAEYVRAPLSGRYHVVMSIRGCVSDALTIDL